MAKKTNGLLSASDTAPLSDEEKLFLRVQQQLDAGQPNTALNLIVDARLKSDRLTNAIGVCQLRRGNADEAVRIFRGLVISEGIHFRQDAPPLFLANSAAALYTSCPAEFSVMTPCARWRRPWGQTQG